MIRKLQIGDVQLENNLILAPMAGVTDLPFRLLCKEQGAGLLCMALTTLFLNGMTLYTRATGSRLITDYIRQAIFLNLQAVYVLHFARRLVPVDLMVIQYVLRKMRWL